MNLSLQQIMNKTQSSYKFYLLTIFLVGLLLFLVPSILCPFHTKGEPREALVAMSMLNNDNYILAYTNGTDIAYKPPFFHWCIAVFSSLFNQFEVSEWTARMPSVVFSILMGCMMFHIMVRKFKGISDRMALLTILVCFSTTEWGRAASACRVDMVNSALMVMNIFLLHRIGLGERPQSAMKLASLYIITSCTLCAAFLTKGPVGIVLPLSIVGLMIIWAYCKEYKQICTRLLSVLVPIIIGSAGALCWYVAAYQQSGARFWDLVMDENIRRFLGKMTYSSHNEPVYYNIVTLLAGLLPYTLLVILSLFAIKYQSIGRWAQNGNSLKKCFSTMSERCRDSEDFHPLAILSCIIILVFYSIPSSKRSVYLLPMYPFLSYYVARLLVWLFEKHRNYVSGFNTFLLVLAALIILAVPLIHLGIVTPDMLGRRHIDENTALLQTIGQFNLQYVILSLILAAGGVMATVRLSTLRMTGLVIAITSGIYCCILPQVVSLKSDRVVAQKIAAYLPPYDLLNEYRSEFEPKNRLHYFTVNFYLGSRLTPYDELDMEHWHANASDFVLMSKEDVSVFRKKYKDLAIMRVLDLNHRSCDDGKDMVLVQFKTKHPFVFTEGKIFNKRPK